MSAQTVGSALIALTVIFSAAQLSAQSKAEAEPPFRSPDGRYELQITKREKDTDVDRVEVIEVATRRPLVLLSDPEAYGDRSENARLDWSADSKRVAAYTGGRHEGTVRLFVLDGDQFAEVKLPKLPDLPEKPSAAFARKHKFKFLKYITTGELEFVRWLKSGDVELRLNNLFAAAGGAPSLGWEITMTVAIDAKHHATLKNVVKKEIAQP